MRHPEDEDILAGGQGRSADEIRESVAVLEWAALVLLTALCVLILGGCARPTAHVRAGDGEQDARGTRAGESSASEKPDRPQWEKLRQQFGGI